MTKPLKRGLEYFPLDTDFIRDLKIQRLMLEFGCEGLSVFIAVLCEAYASQGYYAPVNGGFYSAIAFTVGLDEIKVKKIVHYCLELNLFDQGLYDGELILTSSAIQLRYGVISRRTRNRIKEEFRLVSDADFGHVEKAAHSINNKINKERIKGKENEKENEKENRNENINTKTNKNKTENDNKTEIYENEKSTNRNDDSARRAELRRMAEIATGSCGNV